MPKTRLISPGSIPNHRLLKNLQLNDNYISNDGGDEGIRIADNGLVSMYTVVGDYDAIHNFGAQDYTLKSFADTDDYFKITIVGSGITTMTTVDDSGNNAAKMVFQPQGDIHFTPAANMDLKATIATKTASSTTDSAFKITETLDLDTGAGGSDVHYGLWYDQTQTDLTGWDNVYLMYLDNGRNQLKVDNDSQLIIDINDATASGASTNKAIHIDIDNTGSHSSSGSLTSIGLDLDITKSDSHASSTITQVGIDLDVIGTGDGTTSNTGIDISVSGADTNYPLSVSGGPIVIKEQTAAPDHVSTVGMLWVKDDNPTNLMFTDGGGNDVQMTSSGLVHTSSGVAADNISIGDAAVEIGMTDPDGHIVIDAGPALASGTQSDANIIFQGGGTEFLTFKTNDPSGNGIHGYEASNIPCSEVIGKSNQRLRIRSRGVQQSFQLFSESSLQLAHMITDTDYETAGTSVHRLKNNEPTFYVNCTYDDDPTIVYVADGGRIHPGMYVSGDGIPDDVKIASVLLDAGSGNSSFELQYQVAPYAEVSTTGGLHDGDIVEFRPPAMYINPTTYLKNLQAAFKVNQDWEPHTQVTDQTLGGVGAGNALAQFRGSTSGVKLVILMKTDGIGTPHVHTSIENKGSGYLDKITITGAEYNNESLIDHTAVSGLALYQSIEGEGIPVGAYIGVLNPGSVANRFTIHVEGAAVDTTGGALTGQTLYARDRIVFQDPYYATDPAEDNYMILEVDYAADGRIEFGSERAAALEKGHFKGEFFIDMNQSAVHLISGLRTKLMSRVVQLDSDSVFLSGSSHTETSGQDYTFIHAGDRMVFGNSRCNYARLGILSSADGASNIFMTAIKMNNATASSNTESVWQARGGLQIRTTATTGATKLVARGPTGTATAEMTIAPVGDLILTGNYGTKSVIAKKVVDSTSAATTTAFKVDIDRDGAVTSSTDTNTGILVNIDTEDVNGATQNNIGIDVVIDAAITSGTTTSTGIDIEVAGGNGTGTDKEIGMNIEVSGLTDTSYALLTSGGNVGIGTATPLSLVDIFGGSDTQLRLSYDANNYVTFTPSSSADLTIATVGSGDFDSDITLDADGDIMLDAGSGNFIAKKAGTEFSAANSAYAGMILGYTKIQNDGTGSANNQIPLTTTMTVLQTDQGTDVSVTFVAPPSGKVEIQFSCYILASSTAVAFALSDNASFAEVDESYTYDQGAHKADETDINTIHIPFAVTGLTAGTSYTYFIGGEEITGSSATIYHGRFRATGSHYPPIIVKAVALPATIVTGE